jgi:hypothetical protein
MRPTFMGGGGDWIFQKLNEFGKGAVDAEDIFFDFHG